MALPGGGIDSGMDQRRYPAEGIVVYYAPRLCIHAQECVRGLPEVFRRGERPWVQPQHATTERIAEVIRRCPSGALQYLRLDGGPGEAVPQGVSVRFVPNGPVYLRGPLEFKTPGGEVIFRSSRAALCRCGASKNKPFCDNSHLETGFEAEGAALEVGRDG